MAKNTGRGSSRAPSRKTLPVGKLPSLHWINSREVALDAALAYKLDGRSFVVPRGFVTDFASVPKFLWWLFGPTGLWTWAAILHDWLCKMRWTRRPPASARDTDRFFRLACLEVRVNWVLAWLLWTGVRWGALFNSRRREGWWRDAPLVLVWSAFALVPVLVATAGILFAYLFFLPFRWIARMIQSR